MPKYSIILPVRNAAAYVSCCVESVLSQKYADYELIISNNHSTDGTSDLLRTLNHPNVVKLAPPQSCSMSEHFEWALGKATGEWLMFLGADDGVLPYFFELADRLTTFAGRNRLRAIMSRRAYYFWPGCEKLYGPCVVSYAARSNVRIKHATVNAAAALFGISDYIFLPQMYANSLFHRSLLEEARARQGQVFKTISPDANLAAIACALDSRYVYSHLPLGWIGSSPASNGYCITASQQNPDAAGDSAPATRANDYFSLNTQSQVQFSPNLGNPRLASHQFIFLDALYKTGCLRSPARNRLLKTSMALAIVCASGIATSSGNDRALANLKQVARTNRLPWTILLGLSIFLRAAVLPVRVWRRVCDILQAHRTDAVVYGTCKPVAMRDAGAAVCSLIMQNRRLKRLVTPAKNPARQ